MPFDLRLAERVTTAPKILTQTVMRHDEERSVAIGGALVEQIQP